VSAIPRLPPEGRRAGRHRRARFEGTGPRPARAGVERLQELQEKAVRPGPLVGAPDLSRRWTRPARTARSSTSCPGSIRRVPGVLVQAPSPEELDHDFLWRTTRCLPERGRIGSSPFVLAKEVLVARVHQEILAARSSPIVVTRTSGRSGSRTSRVRALPRRTAR